MRAGGTRSYAHLRTGRDRENISCIAAIRAIATAAIVNDANVSERGIEKVVGISNGYFTAGRVAQGWSVRAILV